MPSLCTHFAGHLNKKNPKFQERLTVVKFGFLKQKTSLRGVETETDSAAHFVLNCHFEHFDWSVLDPCKDDSCFGNATCVPVDRAAGTVRCECPPLFAGDKCEQSESFKKNQACKTVPCVRMLARHFNLCMGESFPPILSCSL